MEEKDVLCLKRSIGVKELERWWCCCVSNPKLGSSNIPTARRSGEGGAEENMLVNILLPLNQDRRRLLWFFSWPDLERRMGNSVGKKKKGKKKRERDRREGKYFLQ